MGLGYSIDESRSHIETLQSLARRRLLCLSSQWISDQKKRVDIA